jgi:hypothetical protein
VFKLVCSPVYAAVACIQSWLLKPVYNWMLLPVYHWMLSPLLWACGWLLAKVTPAAVQHVVCSTKLWAVASLPFKVDYYGWYLSSGVARFATVDQLDFWCDQDRVLCSFSSNLKAPVCDCRRWRVVVVSLRFKLTSKSVVLAWVRVWGAGCGVDAWGAGGNAARCRASIVREGAGTPLAVTRAGWWGLVAVLQRLGAGTRLGNLLVWSDHSATASSLQQFLVYIPSVSWSVVATAWSRAQFPSTLWWKCLCGCCYPKRCRSCGKRGSFGRLSECSNHPRPTPSRVTP